MAKTYTVQKIVSVSCGFVLGLSAHTPEFAHAEAPMFRANGPVALVPPTPWKSVGPLNRDPLSVAQWARGQECSSGASQRLTLFNVDMGLSGPQRLVQRWFGNAHRLQVLAPEAGFILIKAESANATSGLLAFPESDRAITPVMGWIGGVKVVLVGEAASANDLGSLEADFRATLRSMKRVSAKNSRSFDIPYVLAAKSWNKSLASELKRNAEKQPNAKMSLAYGYFNEASGFVPAGQEWLRKAAVEGHGTAQAELLRLSRAEMLAVAIDAERLAKWSGELAAAGHVDERFMVVLNRPFDPNETTEHIKPLEPLVSCGHREARLIWAKHLAESFDKKERDAGKRLVMHLMQTPMLESELPVYGRVPVKTDAPTMATLKKAALLKNACVEEPDADLFVKKSDFLIPKQRPVAAATLSLLESDPFPELRAARELDKLVNSGDRKKLRTAQRLACEWAGSEKDREELIVEVRARRDGFGRWRRFRTCDAVTDSKMVATCAEQENRQASINNEVQFQKLLRLAGPARTEELVELRALAIAYGEAIWRAAQARAEKTERREIDRIRSQVEAEFVGMAKALLSNSLEKEVGEALTAKRLLVLQPEGGGADFTIFRQPASAGFMRKEQLRLEARMAETMKTIDEADRDDLDIEFKKQVKQAMKAWAQYKSKFEALSAQVQAADSAVLTPTSDARFAATVWFYVAGINRLEQLRDRELGRTQNFDVSDL